MRFGPFEMDLSAGKLLRSGTAIKLQRQPFRVLLLLASRPGEVVSREDIQKHLWGDSTFVDFERGINFSINQIRAALSDDPDRPRYIETLPRIGYRFIAEVEQHAPNVVDPPNVEPQPILPGPVPDNSTSPKWFPRHWRKLLAGGIGALLLALAYYIGHHLIQPDPKAIAVLPFQNATGDKDIDFLRFALPDQISTALVNAPSISIRPSAITAKYVGDIDLQLAARKMRVPIIVTGHYLKAGDGLEVEMEAVDVATNKVLWRDTFVATTPEAIALSDQVTGRVSRGLLPALGIFSNPSMLAHPHNEHAYDAYLRSLPMSRDPGVNRDAIALLEQSVSEDPDFAPAWDALGLRYNYAAAYQNGGSK